MKAAGRMALVAFALAPFAGGGSALAASPSFDCVIYPSQTVRLGSPVTGVLSEVLVERGDMVEAGQVIARLESNVEVATVAINRARASGTARIDAQMARVTLSRGRLSRATQLYEKKVMAQDKFDELQAELQVAEQEFAREQLERRLAELEQERSEAQLQQRTIRSATAGVISERKLSAGEFIHQEGYIATLSKLDPLHVEVFLPVDLYPRITLGMIATVRPDDPIGGSQLANVVVVDRVFDAASGTFGVRLALPNPDYRLPAGQRCKIDFDLGTAFIVPPGPAVRR